MSLCDEINIAISKILYDGGKGLKKIIWLLNSSVPANTTMLYEVN